MADDRVTLVCVPPERVHEFWKLASHLIKGAMDRGGLTEFSDVEASVLDGNSATLLWLAWDGEKILAAAVTELSSFNNECFCTIVACGGYGKGEWVHLIDGLEKYAREEGCRAMRIWGRRGWERELEGYGIARVMLQKDLN